MVRLPKSVIILFSLEKSRILKIHLYFHYFSSHLHTTDKNVSDLYSKYNKKSFEGIIINQNI